MAQPMILISEAEFEILSRNQSSPKFSPPTKIQEADITLSEPTLDTSVVQKDSPLIQETKESLFAKQAQVVKEDIVKGPQANFRNCHSCTEAQITAYTEKKNKEA